MDEGFKNQKPENRMGPEKPYFELAEKILKAEIENIDQKAHLLLYPQNLEEFKNKIKNNYSETISEIKKIGETLQDDYQSEFALNNLQADILIDELKKSATLPSKEISEGIDISNQTLENIEKLRKELSEFAKEARLENQTYMYILKLHQQYTEIISTLLERKSKLERQIDDLTFKQQKENTRKGIDESLSVTKFEDLKKKYTERFKQTILNFIDKNQIVKLGMLRLLGDNINYN